MPADIAAPRCMRLSDSMDACASFSGNAKDICLAEAKGKASVAMEKCDDLAGNRKGVGVKEAKSELVKGKANAKVDRVASDTNKEAATTQAEARSEASADRREAEYKVAIEKWDALAGPTKDACVSKAKAQYGKN